MASLLFLTLAFIFFFKLTFKFFKINTFVLIGVVFIVKYFESFLLTTFLGKWLRNLEERMLNFSFFQYIVFLCLIMETFFFFPGELGLSIFDRMKVLFVRTLWLVLVCKGFMVIASPEQIETFFEFVSILIFFFTTFYIHIRVKLLNYQLLQIDTPFVLWSEIIAKLELLGEYCVKDKVKSNSIIMLLSFSRPQASSSTDTNHNSNLSSQKRTMFGSFGRKIFDSSDNGLGRKFFSSLAASGALGGTFYQFANARAENDQQHDAWYRKFLDLDKDIKQKLSDTKELTQEIDSLKKETTKKFMLKLLPWIMDDTKVSSLNLALEKCDIANNDLVRSFIRREALEAALAYNRRIHSFPFFRPIISEHVFSVEKVLNVDILIPLYLKDDKTFFRVIKIISEKMILEGQTTEQLITDIQIQPYLLLENKSLIAQDIISVVPSSFEESVFSFLFKYFKGFIGSFDFCFFR